LSYGRGHWISTATEPSGDVAIRSRSSGAAAKEIPFGYSPVERLEAGTRQVLAYDADKDTRVRLRLFERCELLLMRYQIVRYAERIRALPTGSSVVAGIYAGQRRDGGRLEAQLGLCIASGSVALSIVSGIAGNTAATSATWAATPRPLPSAKTSPCD
jgi:hypothetical protein